MPIHKAWVSECGQYYALEAPGHQPGYDVLAVHGAGVWLHQRYTPAGWDDTDVRYTHAEFPHLTSSWTNLGRWNRGRTCYRTAFRQGFVDIRQDLQVIPFSARREDVPFDAHILARYEATFQTQRRVNRATWEALQVRIAEAIVEGHRRLSAATGATV